MKYFLIITAFLAVTGNVFCQFNDDSSNYGNINAQYLRSSLKRKQALDEVTERFKAICPGKVDEFEEAFIKVKECADEIEESQETVCSAIRNHFLRCSKPMIKVFEDCFPTESKDIPEMVFQSIKSVTNYVCKADGEHIFELMNNCVMKPNYRLSRCERKMLTKTQQFQRRIPTKTDVCEFAHSFKYCIQSHLQYSCGNSITREAVLGLYDALTEPCNDINEIQDNKLTDVEVL